MPFSPPNLTLLRSLSSTTKDDTAIRPANQAPPRQQIAATSAQDHGKATPSLPLPSSARGRSLSLSLQTVRAPAASVTSAGSEEGGLYRAAMASGGRRRKPRRGSARPKAKKKTKYLSLSRIIKAEAETPPRSPEDDDGPAWEEAEVKKEDGGGQQQVEPFALHHEASTLFAAFPAPSLSDILGASADGGGGDESPSPSASPGGAGFPGAEEEDLVRRALRGRERWVYCCSSSSSPSTTATTTTTSSSSPCSSAASTGASARSLLLKLDHEEVLAAWADRGSLYIGHAAPKPEPEPDIDNVFVEVEPPQHQVAAAAACAWSAPETVGSGRAESVRRYKEKRRNRLFAKRIRYEVRRVNAVRRPRFKGRFIKEHEEIEVEPT